MISAFPAHRKNLKPSQIMRRAAASTFQSGTFLFAPWEKRYIQAVFTNVIRLRDIETAKRAVHAHINVPMRNIELLNVTACNPILRRSLTIPTFLLGRSRSGQIGTLSESEKASLNMFLEL